MFDLNQLKSKVTELAGDASRLIKQYTPESFSKEKKFVNALVSSIALMVVADKKVETAEVVKAVEIINEIDQISELNMTREAIELFEMHIENLSEVISNETKYIILVSKMLADISNIKQYPEYPPMVEKLVMIIAESDGFIDELEKKMMVDIQSQFH